MIKHRIFLSGAMSYWHNKGKYDRATKWRERAESYFEFDAGIFNPAHSDDDPFEDPTDTDNGFGYDMWMIKNSTLVLVNFQDVNENSVGTHMELMLAYELGLPIIAINQTGKELHPWINRVCHKICNNEEQAFKYISEHYIFAD